MGRKSGAWATMAKDSGMKFLDRKTVVLSLDEGLTDYLAGTEREPEKTKEAQRKLLAISDGLRHLLSPTLH